ncbi:MAG: MATE family efflux transporter [Myxococcota bacterium]
MREVFALAAPLIIAHLSQSMMWVVDTFLMGRVGNAEQGAVGLGGVLFWAAVCFFAGSITVVTILVAQDFGAGRGDLARHVRTGLLLAVPMSAAVLAMSPFVPEGLSLMRVTEQTRPHAETYLQIRLLGAPLMLGGFVLTSYLRGIGNTFTPMLVVIAANVFNAVVSIVLVFGLLGLPAMGVAGAAWGSVAAAALEASLYALLYLFGRDARAHGSRHLALPTRKDIVDFLTIGAPIGVAWLFEMVAWTAFSIYAGTRPPIELAAHTVLFQVTGFCFMPAMGLGVAASTLVGQYIGAKRPELARKSGRNAMALGVGYMIVVGCALALLREPLMRAFNEDLAVVMLGSTLAIIAAVYQPFDGFAIVAQGVLRGAKQTVVPTIIMLGSGLFVFIPLVWFLGNQRSMGVTGAWIAAVVHVVVVAVLVGIAVMRSRARSVNASVASTA